MPKLITITNSKQFVKERNFVLIPRKEYERLMYVASRAVPEVKLTPSQRRAIRASEKELKSGNYMTLSELEYVLGRPRSKTRI